MPPSPNTEKINQTFEMVSALDRAIRGNNGTPGLLAQVALMNQTLLDVQTDVKKINENGCDYKFRNDYEAKNTKPLPATPEKPERSRLGEYAEKVSVPIIVALILGFFEVLPKLVIFFDQLAIKP